MRWATIFLKGDPQKTRLVAVREEGFVDIAGVYRWSCQRKGQQPKGDYLAPLLSMEGILKAGLTEDITIKELLNEWSGHVASGDESAMHCIIPLNQATVTLPFQPGTFRDFYAFENHVAVCRNKRGLAMVPEWYKVAAFYFGNPRSFVGPGAKIIPPQGCRELDFELEIACVIGKSGGSIKAEEAESFIAGYTILNDWSARDIQREEMKIGLGPAKGKDFATSMGPYLVTPEELEAHRVQLLTKPRQPGKPYATVASSDDGSPATDIYTDRFDLEMTSFVNDRLISKGNFKAIHYTFAEIIERASRDTRLEAGDVIGSGTVGTGCILEVGADVQPWLQPGDVVRLGITSLGELENTIAARSIRR